MRRLAVCAALLLLTAAVPEGLPSDTAFPHHRSYLYGSEDAPYRMSFFAGNWFVGRDDFFLFEPVAGADTPKEAPLVVLLQGFVLDGPWQFDHLIRHLTRRGMSVVYPAYLNLKENAWSFADWLERSTRSIQAALFVLAMDGRVPVARDAAGRPKLAFVAHSIGSYVASFLAQRAAVVGDLPAPLAMVFLDPAGHDYKQVLGIDSETLADIDPATEAIFLSAEDALLDEEGGPDANTQDAVADLAGHLPLACGRLSAWLVRSDVEGDTQLVSDHYDGPQTHQVLDAIDWWGYWPQLSAHLEYAFWGRYGAFRHAGGLAAGHWLDDGGKILRPIRPRVPHPRVPSGYPCALP